MPSTTQEQIDKIKALIKSAKNPKQKKDYQKILENLNEKLKEENKNKPKVVAVKPSTPTKPTGEALPVNSKPLEQPLEQKPVRTTRTPLEPLESTPVEVIENSTEAKKPKKLVTVKPTGKPVDPKKDDSPQSGENGEEESTKAKSEDSDRQEKEDEDDGKPKPFFQAIGIIKGEVTVTEEKSTVKLNGKEYRLYYVPGRRLKVYQALKHEIESTGNNNIRLIVYPKVLHLPKRDQPHVVAFQLVGFMGSNSKPTPLNQELKDGEFKLLGLWQFIPVCRTPCVSIFRNFTKERLDWIKETEPHRKVKFMKSSHIPLLWKDSPVKPFRFNPKLDKEEQGKPKFVQVKVKFLPGRDVFGFVEELAEARDKAPGFLKASKKLKAEAMASAKEYKKQQEKEAKQQAKVEATKTQENKPKETKVAETKA